jgi:hypothetical protein
MDLSQAPLGLHRWASTYSKGDAKVPDDLVPYRPRALAREERQTAAILRREQLPAKRAVARLQASSFVAHVGMTNTALLTNLEAQMVKRGGAMLDARIAAIVDAYSGACVTELLKLSL